MAVRRRIVFKHDRLQYYLCIAIKSILQTRVPFGYRRGLCAAQTVRNLFKTPNDMRTTIDPAYLILCSATSFQQMFQDTSAFNQPIGNWDTGSSTSFKQMFQGAAAFSQPIKEWDTSATSVGYFSPRKAMFENATLMLADPYSCPPAGPPSDCKQ